MRKHLVSSWSKASDLRHQLMGAIIYLMKHTYTSTHNYYSIKPIILKHVHLEKM